MRKHFDFYAYCSPNSGKYFVDGQEYFLGEDFRSVKRYKEYKNVGFTVLLLQAENSYGGEPFETSACNKCMTIAEKAGIKRIIVSDTRLKDLCEEKNLFGSGGRFENEKAFLAYLDECTLPYRNHKCFYGIQLRDEPTYDMFPSYGAVIKGLKQIIPNVYLQCNLLPGTGKEQYGLSSEESDMQAFEKYLNGFSDASGTDSLLFDEYPFRREYMIGGYSVSGYIKVGKVCKERGIEFRTVLQSFSHIHNGRLQHRRVTEPDMYWQTNMAMGFGCREYSFFTYLTKPDVKIGSVTDGIDGAAFINRDGTRTKLYYFTKKIIREIKRFERVLLKYEYDNCYFAFGGGKEKNDFEQTEYADERGVCPIDVKADNGVVLITRQKGEKSDLYMIENIGNLKDELFGGADAVTASINLGKDAKSAKFYVKGKRVFRKSVKGVFSEKLKVGDAVFISVKNRRR